MTDTELLDALARGDQSAFAALVQRHADWVWGCALRQTADTFQAEDITQAAFLLLARKAPALLAHGSMEKWLFRVVHYLARDAHKLANRRQYHESKVATMTSEQAPEHRDWGALSAVLDDAVARLRTGDRQCILLRFYQGLSLAQVAAALELTEDAATKRVSRAVARLKVTLHRQGITTSTDVQELLTGGISCVAPAALVARISGGGSTAAASALASKAAVMLFAAKLKVVGAMLAATVVATAITTAAVLSTRPSPPSKPPSAAAVPAAAPITAETDLQAPPIHTDKQVIAVNRTILLLPQSAADQLIAATQLVASGQGLQTRSGPSVNLHPLLRSLLPQVVGKTPITAWPQARGFNTFDGMQQLTFRSGPFMDWINFTPRVTASAGPVTQIAGSFNLSNAASGDYTLTPVTLQSKDVLVQIVPLAVRTVPGLNLIVIYEAIPIDSSDLAALGYFSDGAGWLGRPVAESLRIARAGSIWQGMVPESRIGMARSRAKKLPGGAEIWVEDICDPSVHPLARWAVDGQPYAVQESGKQPMASIGISDPNLPSRFGSPERTYDLGVWVPLSRQDAAGYSCTIAFGDGPYKTVASMPASKGATATVQGCPITVVNIDIHGQGEFRVTGRLPRDMDVDIVAIRKDRSIAWNRGRHGLFLADDAEFVIEPSFSFGLAPSEIDHLEIRTRPFRSVTFDKLAKRPAIPLPTGLESAVDPEAARDRRLAAATPPGRKAALDGITCVRMWSGGSPVSQDRWLWRDGRFRFEMWTAESHLLTLGDARHQWDYDFAMGRWSPGKATRPDMTNFKGTVEAIAGIGEAVAIGDIIGSESVHGVPCTVRAARMESNHAKVWLDATGIVHRLDYLELKESIIIDYDPADADHVWTVRAEMQKSVASMPANTQPAKAVP